MKFYLQMLIHDNNSRDYISFLFLIKQFILFKIIWTFFSGSLFKSFLQI